MTRLEVDLDFTKTRVIKCEVRVVQECTAPRKQRADEALIADGIRKYVVELINDIAKNAASQEGVG